MKKTFLRITYLRITFSLFLLIILSFSGFLAWQTLTEFRPMDEEICITSNISQLMPDTMTIVTWNIGYCGLGKEMDFFYEGGKQVKPNRALYNKYKKEVMQRLATFNAADIIFLQEIDSSASRSYNDNQLSHIRTILPHELLFSLNYNAWVPIPITKPMGKVKAGLATLTKYVPNSAKRVYYESSYSWPKSLFMLKRCFIETRYKTKAGKDLVLINTHNSAFDDATELREKELAKLQKIMIEEYNNGNYVIVGGDWNQNPPSFDTATVMKIYNPKFIKPSIEDEYLPKDWIYAFDSDHTTNRDVNIPYKEGITTSSLIDFFILSPNITLQSVKVIPTGYKESDHQPVVLKISL